MRSTVKLWPARESGLVMHIYYLRRVPGIIIMFQTKYVKSLASAGFILTEVHLTKPYIGNMFPTLVGDMMLPIYTLKYAA